ncbi:non-ribosomal peptide synthetase [Pseudomonas chlororaphis]|uniref:non-ribosomal peptide synthetase n=1 Tax=Pseudomonas chlororaphis TaxID=587753 RepID=UPI000F5722AF|nr:non-ribosomal peptide synthetase [Pseudomonas chlororaphis]AZE04942.1 Siderophore biosynthesis non-ribosomal peptide synthetase [Pseudomonas chlororaphis subsp. aureofaciens]MBP5064893.1 amino acid adenylation domain-containing protein [Pseudomonas chlororaphis]QTT94447.1 amino acid adenylation domain-containing protein [Pseudomonas chlororaphis]
MSSISSVAGGGDFALTSSQMGVFLGHELSDLPQVYNGSDYWLIRGRVDVPCFKRAVCRVVAEASSLHIRLYRECHEVRQTLEPQEDFDLEFIDFSNAPEPLAMAREHMFGDTEQACDLFVSPLFKFTLICLSANEFIFYQRYHHIVQDGLGSHLIIHRLAEVYSSLLVNQVPTPGSFGPFEELVAADIAYRNSAKFERDREYWTSRFQDVPEPLSLARKEAPLAGTCRYRKAFSSGVVTLLHELPEKLGFNFSQLLIALTCMYLYKMTGQQEVVVGLPVTGRVGKSQRNIPGLMSNILPIRLSILPKHNLQDVLSKVRREVKATLLHQQYRYEDILRDLNLLATQQELFKATVNIERFGRTPLFGEAVASPNNIANGPAKDLNIFFFCDDATENIVLGMDANSLLYDESQLESYADGLQGLFTRVLNNPQSPVGLFNLLSPQEAQRALLEPNQTSCELPRLTLPELFEAQVERTPEALALGHGDEQLTYRQLNDRVNRMAHLLVELEVSRGDGVGVSLSRSTSMLVALLAIAKVGATYIPMDPYYPQERLNTIVEVAKPVLMLVERSGRYRPARGVRCCALDDARVQEWLSCLSSQKKLRTTGAGLDAAYVLFTSGSTGTPKGVVIPHGCLSNFLFSMQRQLQLQTGDRFLATTTLGFDIAGLELFLPLISGAQVIIASREAAVDPMLLAAQISHHRITHLQGTPALWQGLVEYQPQALASLTALVGGDSLGNRLAGEMCRLAQRVYHVYGPTETTIWSTLHRLDSDADEALSIGSPILNTQVYILDSGLQPLPAGQAGELYIAGQGLARGYLSRPDITSDRFVANPYGEKGSRMYRTGDLAYFGTDQRLYFLGRADNQVKIRGYRIELGEIEAALGLCPGVKNAVVVARAEPKQLVGYVVADEGQALSSQKLREAVGEQLPDYMVPAAIMILPVLPLTPNGKVNRAALPVPTFEARSVQLAITSQEQVLCGVFAEVLAIAPPGIDESFFDLGGHSLLAMQLVSRLRSIFQVELPLKAVFDAPTVGQLCEVIGRSGLAPSRAPLEKQPRPLLLPMSFAQQRLWFLEEVSPSSAYNMPLVLQMTGGLDEVGLRLAVQDVLLRHESLRTLLSRQEGVAVQQVVEATQLVFQLERQEIEAGQLQQCLLQACGQHFELSRELPVKGVLYALDAEHHVLLLLVHHSAGDGGSLRPLMNDLATAYRAWTQGGAPDWPALPVQYADYCLWQRQLLGDERTPTATCEQQIQYWKQQLAGLPDELRLATDHARRALPSHQGGQVALDLPASLYPALQALAQSNGASLFMVLQACLALFLHRMGAGTDIPLGTPVDGRTDQALTELVGFFVNTLVLRTDLSGDPDMPTLIARVRETTLQGIAHQDVPFERIVEELNPVRSLSRHPLFQIMLVLQNHERSTADFSPLKVEQQELQVSTAKFDLSFVFDEDRGSGLLRGHIEYATDLYEVRTVTALAERLVRLLEAVVEQPQQRISQFALLAPEERRQVLQAWNDTSRPLPEGSLAALFERQVRRTPEAIAVSAGQQRLSYRQLNTLANRLAHRLTVLTNDREPCIGLLLERSIECVVAMLATIKMGGAYVPLRPGDPVERQQMMLDDAGVRILLSESAMGRPALRVEQVVFVDEDSTLFAEDFDDLRLQVAPDSLAYIMYSSGSTGAPKGIAVTQENIIGLACDQSWRQGDYQRVLLHSSIAFDASTFEFWVPLLHGGRLIVAPRGELDVATLADIIVREEVSALWLTAGLFRLIAEEEPGCLAGVRQVLAGGDVLPKAAVAALLARHPQQTIINGYGPTEATTFTTLHRMNSKPPHTTSVPIGSPLDNTRVYVLDDYLQPVPVGVRGELYIAGSGLARGYVNNAGLTARHFVANPFGAPGERLYRTGDLVRWHADQVLEYLGRGDSQLKIRGFRIETGEVEAVLALCPGVAQVLVKDFEDRPGNKQLVAYVIAQEGVSCGQADVILHARTHLPDYMVPAAVTLLEQFPLTANGKIDQRALPAPEFIGGQGRDARNVQEDLLCRLFADTLGVDAVGIDDNFFELGGHSLLAMRLINSIRKTFNVELSVRSLFEAPCVAQLGEQLTQGAPARPALQARPRPEQLRLSFAQQRLWLIDRIEGRKATYNMPLVVHLDGTVDEQALATALNDVVQRHESLRTRFHEQSDGQAYQYIVSAEAAACELLCHDVTAEQLPGALAQASQHLFDLARENPFRAWLFRQGPQRSVLLLLMHHIASDGASLEPLLEDFSASYNARLQGQAPQWQALSVQYADYTLWQRDLLGDGHDAESTLSRLLDYWKKTLDDLPQELPLPFDRPRGLTASYRGEHLQFLIEPALHQALQNLARQHNASLYMLLQAALSVLLNRLGGGIDIPLGMAIAGRTDAALAPLVGFFTNTLVLRSDVSGNPSFSTLLKRVREQALQAYAHQEVPFETLVEALNPERSLARHPLFQVMLVLQNQARGTLELDQLQSRVEVPQLQVAKFDLTFNIIEGQSYGGQAGELKGEIEYATDLFDEQTVSRIAGYFISLLSSIVQAPQTPIAQLPMLAAQERQQMLVDWSANLRETLPARTFPEQFEYFVQHSPDALALLGDGIRLTYAQLNQRAERLARYMRMQGVGVEDVVAVALPRSVEMIVSLLAILKAGAAYLSLDPDYPLERLRYMLEDAAPRLLLSNRPISCRLCAACPCVYLDDPETQALLAGLSDSPAVSLSSGLQVDNAAYVIYTSGSTGRPKAVWVTHRGINSLATSVREAFKITTQSRVLQFASPSFDAAFWDISMALLNGARLVIADADSLLPGEALSRLIDEQGVTHATLPPVGLAVMPRENTLPTLDTLVVAGDACQPELVEHWSKGRRMINAYGPSEATVCSTFSPPLSGRTPLSIGSPIINSQVYVLDRYLQPVPPGVDGDLYIAGQGLARGYMKQPQLTAERFVANPYGAPGSRMYRSGDVARWRADGQLVFVGRADQQIKIRGFRVELGEIESVLLQHEAVAQVAVIMRESASGHKQLLGYVVPHDADFDPRNLRQYLLAQLPDYMVPAALIKLGSIPTTPNGKLDRRALPEPEKTQGDTRRARNRKEGTLCELFAEVLALEHVGIDDSFFELGGDSITAIQLVARARLKGWRLLPRQIFEHKNPAALAQQLEPLEEVSGEEQVAAIGTLPATPIIHWLADNPGSIEGFAQSVLLQVPSQLSEPTLRQLMALLVCHHDVLRLRAVRRTGQSWTLEVPGADQAESAFTLQVVNAAALDDEQLRQSIVVHAEQAKRRLSPEQGRMAAVVWFERGPDKPGRLLWILHHLVVDGVSWRILVSDLEAAWQALVADRIPMLAPVQTSFRAWAHKLADEAAGRAGQLPYWSGVLNTPDPLLSARALDPEQDTTQHSASLQVELPGSFTQPLLGSVPALFHGGVNDVLLAAFALAICDWRRRFAVEQGTAVLLDVEGHGRETVAGAELSRTVGWFTSLYPVCLDPGRVRGEDPTSLGQAIKRVKEQLRQVPGNGLDFGLLRYLDPTTAPQLAALGSRQIGFNYMGRLAAGNERDWAPVEDSALLDPAADADFALPHGISLNAVARERAGETVLVAHWTWAEQLFDATDIQALAERWFHWLRAFSQLGDTSGVGGLTPSDLAMVSVEQSALDKLQSKWKKKK